MIVQLCADDLWKAQVLVGHLYAQPEAEGSMDADHWRQTWLRLLESGEGVWFAYMEGALARSVLGASTFRHINTGRLQASVITAYTPKKYQQRGYSTALFQAFTGWAREKGCGVAYTNYLVGRENFEPVSKVFEREGYKLHEQVFRKGL